MSTIVKGIYRNGQVRLLETPEGVEEAEVVVTFPDDAYSVQDAATREAHRQLLLKRLRATTSGATPGRCARTGPTPPRGWRTGTRIRE